MSHPPDAHHEIAVPVDRARAEALRARLHDELDRRGTASPTPRSESAELQEMHVTTPPSDNPARRRTIWAAAAVAALGLGALVYAVDRDRPRDGPAAGAGTPAPTSSTTSTSTTSPPLSDAEIAAEALPDPRAWGDGWTSAKGYHTVEMRGGIAAQVPECAAHLAAFESPDRPATIDYQIGFVNRPAAIATIYIAVFPDEPAAEEMFDATTDAPFVSDCAPAYNEKLFEVTGLSLETKGFPIMPFTWLRPKDIRGGQYTYGDMAPIAVDVDEQWTRVQLGAVYDERYQIGEFRVGRVIIVMFGAGRTSKDAAGYDPVQMTDEQFADIVRDVVSGVRSGLGPRT